MFKHWWLLAVPAVLVLAGFAPNYLIPGNNLSDLTNKVTALKNLLAPGSSGNVITSDGTKWNSVVPVPSVSPVGGIGAVQTKASPTSLGAYAGTACGGGLLMGGLDANATATGCSPGGGSPANPSGLIGMTPTNGAAGTFDRSDSTHAIDSALVPTWTGLHTFNGGLSGTMTNPTISGDATDRWLGQITVNYDYTANVGTGFTDANGLQVVQNTNWAQFSYGNGTNAKWTTIPLNVFHTSAGAGQTFTTNETLTKYGMGDTFLGSRRLTFAGGPINGDEGIGFDAVSGVQQQRTLVTTVINGVPVRTTCNTTVNQGGGITGSTTAQAVTVTSTTGCNVNDWLVIQPELGTATPNHEAVQIANVGGGAITGIFRNNHSNGVAITPALVLTVGSNSQFGQNRILVDLSGSSYSTGTVSSISGGAFTGSGTTWTTGIVGDNGTNNIGCIALTNDDYTGSPFSGGAGTLKSWYQISGRSSNTSISIYKTSVAGDAGYNGKGVGSGAYIIRPCAEVLVINGTTVVLSTSAATWTNGDNLELAISPYPDVSGHQEVLSVWTPGGALRRGFLLSNQGARTFTNALEISANLSAGGGADTIGWATGVSVSGSAIGYQVDSTVTQAAMVLPLSTHASISWGPLSAGNPVNEYIGYTTVGAGDALLLHSRNGTGGAADVGALSLSNSTDPRAWLGFNGGLALGAIASSSISTRLRFHDDNGDPQAATGLIDLRYVTSSGATDGQSKYWATNTGLIFSSTNSDYVSGHDVFVIAGDNGPQPAVVGSPELAVATNGNNKNSGYYRWEGSVWNGSAAAARWMQAAVFPATGTNGQISWELLAITPTISYNTSFPDRPFYVREDGVVSLGFSNPDNGNTPRLAALDPTGLTANRTFTLPDIGGELTPTTGTKTTSKCLAFNASGQIIASATAC